MQNLQRAAEITSAATTHRSRNNSYTPNRSNRNYTPGGRNFNQQQGRRRDVYENLSSRPIPPRRNSGNTANSQPSHRQDDFAED